MPAPRSRTEGIFAAHALELQAFGLAVVPSNGKVPLVKNFQRWRGPPSMEATERLVRRFPDANVAILPGPSRVFVADVDTADQVDEVQKLLGPTPLQIATSRGRHLYYRHVNGCSDLPGNLKKKLGLNVDLKRGSSIVIAPPSKHQSGATYEHVNCDWRDLERIPPPNLERLHGLLNPHRSVPSDRLIEGERGLGFNRLLCRVAAFCQNFDELMVEAAKINADFCLPPLIDAEVVKRAKDVWKGVMSGKIVRWIGRKAIARAEASELKRLCAMDRNGMDAFGLLIFLRTQHGARHSRGNTFAIAAEAMHRKQSIPGWHSKRIVAARKLLLRAAFLEQVTPPKSTRRGKVAAQYRFVGAS